MTILDVLKQEYKDWAAASNRPQNPDTMLEFLEARGALRPRYEMPIMAFGNKTYILSICLNTDRDFFCDYPGFVYDDYQTLFFTKTWGEGEDAQGETLEILRAVKAATKSCRGHVQEYIDRIFDMAIREIETGGYTYTQLSGNYEGSLIAFGETDCI